MKIEYTSHFKRAYRKLPLTVRRKAEKRELIFREDPFDPRINTHKLSGKLKEFHSFSINQRYRIVFVFRGRQQVVFLDAGDHGVYR
jgi:addiction module RelE/StbE family toxin